jgi:hypothetical protein
MKKIMLLTALLSSSIWGMSQSERAKEIQIKWAAGIGVYGVGSELAYDDGTIRVTETDQDSAVTTYNLFQIRYELHPRISVGLELSTGSYLYDPNKDNTGFRNTLSYWGVNVEGNAVTSDRHRLYGGMTLKSTRLQTEEPYIDFPTIGTQEVNYRGPGYRLYAGYMYYIAGGPIGIHLQGGYDSQHLELRSLYRNGTVSDLRNITGFLDAKGIQVMAGLSVRIKTK